MGGKGPVGRCPGPLASEAEGGRPGLLLWGSPLLGAQWVAAVHSSLGVIYKLGRPMVVRYLRGVFTPVLPQVATAQPPGTVRAAVEGVLSGLGQGLPVSAAGQSFAWPYLLGRPAILPAADPAAWAAALLGAAVGLAALLRADWSAAWRGLRHRRPEAGGPEALALAAAIVPCWLLQLRLGAWAAQFEAAAGVGLLLVVTGQALQVGERWGRLGSRTPGPGGGRMPPWLALLGGLAAGFAALPGLSALAVLLAAALYGRLSAERAGRFALMAATGVIALQALTGLPALAAGFRPSLVVLAAGAAVGAVAGGWLLQSVLRAAAQRALPVVASYCTALGALVLMFGVFQR